MCHLIMYIYSIEKPNMAGTSEETYLNEDTQINNLSLCVQYRFKSFF